MTLADLKIGQDAVLRTIGGQGELRHHLLDMGLTPGTEVTLRKEGVALVRFLLCKQKNAVPRRQIQGAVKARSAGADDDYVKIVIHISHFHVVSSVSSVIPTLTV